MVELGIRNKEMFAEKAREIRLVVTDIDGVWTDAKMYYSPQGDYLKAFSTYDGMAVKLLRENNIPVAILTGENTEMVKQRAGKLCIKYVYLGETEKLKTLEKLCEKLDITLDEVAYIGDDVNDLEVLAGVGLSAMPSSSPILDQFSPDLITGRGGGEGAFREFADSILKYRQE